MVLCCRRIDKVVMCLLIIVVLLLWIFVMLLVRWMCGWLFCCQMLYFVCRYLLLLKLCFRFNCWLSWVCGMKLQLIVRVLVFIGCVFFRLGCYFLLQGVIVIFVSFFLLLVFIMFQLQCSGMLLSLRQLSMFRLLRNSCGLFSSVRFFLVMWLNVQVLQILVICILVVCSWQVISGSSGLLLVIRVLFRGFIMLFLICNCRLLRSIILGRVQLGNGMLCLWQLVVRSRCEYFILCSCFVLLRIIRCWLLLLIMWLFRCRLMCLVQVEKLCCSFFSIWVQCVLRQVGLMLVCKGL